MAIGPTIQMYVPGRVRAGIIKKLSVLLSVPLNGIPNQRRMKHNLYRYVLAEEPIWSWDTTFRWQNKVYMQEIDGRVLDRSLWLIKVSLQLFWHMVCHVSGCFCSKQKQKKRVCFDKNGRRFIAWLTSFCPKKWRKISDCPFCSA